MAARVAELNPLDDLGQAILAVEFSPFLLGGHHQLEGHGQSGLAAVAPLGAFCPVPDGGEDAFDYYPAGHVYMPKRADLTSGCASSVRPGSRRKSEARPCP